ncbi:hypothetical protein L6252_02605 [Candidatus Parcubacteria bacterium]|nr:hypothetical protein [Candidatus Parcubacteria bacterium]
MKAGNESKFLSVTGVSGFFSKAEKDISCSVCLRLGGWRYVCYASELSGLIEMAEDIEFKTFIKVNNLFDFIEGAIADLIETSALANIYWPFISITCDRLDFIDFFEAKHEQYGFIFFSEFFNRKELKKITQLFSGLEDIRRGDSKEKALEHFWCLFGFTVCLRAAISQATEYAKEVSQKSIPWDFC